MNCALLRCPSSQPITTSTRTFDLFAIGRSIWEDAIDRWVKGEQDDDATVAAIADEYAGYAARWT